MEKVDRLFDNYNLPQSDKNKCNLYKYYVRLFNT